MLVEVLFLKTSKKSRYKREAGFDEHRTREKTKSSKPSIEKKIKEKEKKLPGTFYPVLSAVFLVIIITLVIILLLRNTSLATNPVVSDNKVKVEFYVMSQCPYGTQVEDAFYPVLEQMGDVIDFNLDYIVTEPSPGQFQSLHGEKEVKGDIVQLCAKKYYPENYVYMKFIVCQNKDRANVDTNWVGCAKENNMDVEKLRSCLEGDEGKMLLRESMQRTQAMGATASPTMYFNDALYKGRRDSLSFQRAVCQHVEHEACKEIPECVTDADCTAEKGMIGVCNNAGQPDAYCTYKEPVSVEYIILTSADCKGAACDTTRIVEVTQQLFLGAKPRPVDASSEEGKQLIEEYNIQVVPAYIFDKSLEETKSWKENPDLRTAFEKTGDKYKLRDAVTGATYFVNEEARIAYYDAIGVTLGDNKPQIDFFVMSYCPFGNQAEQAIEPVYQLLKDKAEFKPHYVIYSNYRGGGPNYCINDDKLCSMHGIQELHQDIREACVLKYDGIANWFKFALAMNTECNSGNADSCWEPVAESLGLDTDRIKQCEEEEAVELMTADKQLGDKLKVRGSPTVFIDGELYSGPRTPEAYKQALCKAFDEPPEECNTTLEGSTEAQPQGNC